MCQHLCKCGASWSHQEFGNVISESITRFDPCPFPELYDSRGQSVHLYTLACPTCYVQESRKRTNGHDKLLSPKGVISQMDEQSKRGQLTAQAIIAIQLEEEAIFNLLVKDLDDEQMELHYTHLLEMRQEYQARALHYRQLKQDYDIEQMSKCSDADRAAFEELKAKKVAERKEKAGPSIAAVRQSRQQKYITDWADKMQAGVPGLTREEALERATKMFSSK